MSNIHKYESVRVSLATPYVLNDDFSVSIPAVASETVSENINSAEADAIIAAARQYAESIVAKARLEAEGIKQQVFEEARKDGYEQGYKDGYRIGLERGQAQYDNMIQQAQCLIQEAQQQKDNVLKEAEAQLVELAITISQQILDHEIKTNREVIVYLVQKALKHSWHADDITVRVRDEDYGTLIEHIKDLRSAKGERINISVLKDNSLLPGVCVVETPSGIIDASIDTQMDKLKAQLKLLTAAVNS